MHAQFIEAQHASELACFAMAARAILARAQAEDPNVKSVLLLATAEDGLEISVDAEFRNRAGIGLGGWQL